MASDARLIAANWSTGSQITSRVPPLTTSTIASIVFDDFVRSCRSECRGLAVGEPSMPRKIGPVVKAARWVWRNRRQIAKAVITYAPGVGPVLQRGGRVVV